MDSVAALLMLNSSLSFFFVYRVVFIERYIVVRDVAASLKYFFTDGEVSLVYAYLSGVCRTFAVVA